MLSARSISNSNCPITPISATRGSISSPTARSRAAAYAHQFPDTGISPARIRGFGKSRIPKPRILSAARRIVAVEAKYYAGGGLANAEANWTVTATPTNYTPPNRGDFTFGTWVPWWRVHYDGEMSYGGGGRTTAAVRRRRFKGVTDASGKHLLKIDFESVNPPRPYSDHGSGIGPGCKPPDVVELDLAARPPVVALRRDQNAADVRPERRKDRGRIDRLRHRR